MLPPPSAGVQNGGFSSHVMREMIGIKSSYAQPQTVASPFQSTSSSSAAALHASAMAASAMASSASPSASALSSSAAAAATASASVPASGALDPHSQVRRLIHML